MKNGNEVSLREITDDIVNLQMFNDIENKILSQGDIKMDIKIKLDKRSWS